MQSSAIKIGSRVWSIAILDLPAFQHLLGKKNIFDDEIKSFADYDEQLIVVRADLEQNHCRELVLHELIHACLDDAGVQTGDYEKFVSALAPRLNNLMDQNLFDVLVELEVHDV